MSARDPDSVTVEAIVVDGDGSPRPRSETVAIEEPLEIRLAGDPLATTMRTPGHDEELVTGLLLSEGLIRSRADLGRLARCGRPGDEGYGNVMDALPGPGFAFDHESLGRTRRGTLVTASCGICGRVMIDDLVSRLEPADPSARFDQKLLGTLTARLSAEQPGFARTGGLHAAGVAVSGELLVVREDVGRHNAVDKVIGRLVLDDRLPIASALLVVSGRISFEIVQKVSAARLSAVVGVSAPSSLAIATAHRLGIVLAGFAREGRFTVYAGADRLDPPCLRSD